MIHSCMNGKYSESYLNEAMRDINRKVTSVLNSFTSTGCLMHEAMNVCESRV